MPNNLMDMFQARSLAGNEPIGFGDALAQNRQSLIGLGMGLLQPISLAQGAPVQSPWGNALGGYQQGAAQDARQANVQAQLAHQKRQEAFQRAQAAQHQANFERTFARGDVTDAQRAMNDVLGPGATPEQKADFMKSYYASKTEQPGGWILKDIIDPSDPEGERKITVQEHNRTGQIRPPQLPGQTGTGVGAPPAVNWTPGATNAPVYGAGGDFGTPAAAPAAAQPPSRAITMPNGQVLSPPPGLNKDGRKAWQTHIAQTAADVSSGKMTEAQGTSNLYAGKMAIADSALTPELEKQGLDPTQNRLEKYGGWAGNVLLMNPEYQKYRDAKDAFLNSYLRRISGATVHDAEYLREEKVFFPQPGDPPEQLEYKRRLRADAIQRMKAQVGMGYQEPPAAPTARPVTPQAGGGAAPAGPPTGTRTGGAGMPAPPPGFTIVQ